ncbi:hypothetical protein EB796_003055 [Bugula neritina]|uniref:Uncharacterized protein n=1 Tax=Bugula neritina TaxID=10212 RepID=A0A7J7KKZ1_BUGNE|nr:hypothetical protein EB796_003055 [Bugula neritina]
MWEPDFDAVGENLHRAKGNYVDHFDCYVCDVIHENMKREEAGVKVVNWQADKEHYGCPLPMEYITESDLTKLRPYSEFWYSVWMASYCDMWAFLSLSRGGREAYLPNSFQQLSKTCLIEEYWRTQDMG